MTKPTPWAPGRRFGKLTVLIPSGRKIKPDGTKLKEPVALCICECGTLVTPRRCQLTGGNRTRSCFKCSVKVTHGQIKTPEYTAWINMKNRCNNPNNPNWKDYGGRGIKICERWNKFQNFISDMGKRPSKKHTLDRIDNNRGYSPDNCKWSTQLEQCNNRRSSSYLELNGVKKTMSEWTREMGLPIYSINNRIRIGWTDPEKILLTPVFGKPLTDAQKEWTNRLNNQDPEYLQPSLFPEALQGH